MVSLANSTKHLKNIKTSHFSNFKKTEEKETPLNLFYEASIPPLSKPDKDTARKLQAVTPMNINVHIPLSQQQTEFRCIVKVVYPSIMKKWYLFLESKDGSTYENQSIINIICNINRRKGKI